MSAHRLAALLEAAARGTFPEPDGRVEVLPPPPGRAMAVVAFTAHHVVAADVPEQWVREMLPEDDLLAPLSPRFLAALEERLGRHDDGVDVLLAAAGRDGRPALVETDASLHSRFVRAHAHREDVRAYTAEGGGAVVTLGRGLALRTEVSVEVDPDVRGRGLASQALVEARRLVGPGGVVFAQVAPGNAASLRAFLRAGFEPIGSEALFF